VEPIHPLFPEGRIKVKIEKGKLESETSLASRLILVQLSAGWKIETGTCKTDDGGLQIAGNLKGQRSAEDFTLSPTSHFNRATVAVLGEER